MSQTLEDNLEAIRDLVENPPPIFDARGASSRRDLDDVSELFTGQPEGFARSGQFGSGAHSFARGEE